MVQRHHVSCLGNSRGRRFQAVTGQWPGYSFCLSLKAPAPGSPPERVCHTLPTIKGTSSQPTAVTPSSFHQFRCWDMEGERNCGEGNPKNQQPHDLAVRINPSETHASDPYTVPLGRDFGLKNTNHRTRSLTLS